MDDSNKLEWPHTIPKSEWPLPLRDPHWIGVTWEEREAWYAAEHVRARQWRKRCQRYEAKELRIEKRRPALWFYLP